MSDPTQSSQKSNASSSLYLVTFLATLFLLLFVSCAIVLRSYILRRRYQRRLDEAMAAGMLLAPRAQGSKRKRFGTKPRIYDTWLADGGDLWHSMTPLSAQPVFVKRKVKEGTKPPGQDDTPAPDALLALPENGNPGGPPVVINNSATPSPSATPRTRFWIPNPPPSQQQLTPQRSFLPWRRRPQQPDTSANPNTPSTDPANPQGAYKVRVEMLQVSVLISMPSPSRAARKNPGLNRQQKKLMLSDAMYEGDEDDDDDEVPPLADLAFGVIRVNYRHSKASLLPPASIAPSVLPASTTPQLGPLVIPSPIPTPLLTTPLPTPVPTPGPERPPQFPQ